MRRAKARGRHSMATALPVLASATALAACIATSAFGQLDTEWTLVHGGELSDEGSAAAPTRDGGFILAGTTSSSGAGAEDVLLVKVDGEGNVQWEVTHGDAARNFGQAVQQTSDGGYIVAGYTGIGPIAYDALLIKTDGLGQLQWQRTFGGAGKDEARSVIEVAGGGYVLCGDIRAEAITSSRFLVVRTDEDGQPMWQRAFGSLDDHAYALAQTPDGGFAVAGYSGDGSTFQEFDARLLKISPSGGLAWQRTFDESIDDRGFTLQVLPGGGLAMGGLSGGQFALWRTTAAGNLVWFKDHGTATADNAFALALVPDGGFLLGGYTWRYEDGEFQMFVVKLDGAGDFQWQQFFGGSAWEFGWSLAPAGGGGFLLLGSTNSFGSGGYDLYAVRLGADSSVTGIAGDILPPRLSLGAAPNPFNPRVEFSFHTGTNGPVRLRVMDLAGRPVATLLDGAFAAGPHNVTWDGLDDAGRRVSSGVYLVELQAERQVVRKKVTLLK